MTLLVAEKLHKRFGSRPVVVDVHLDVHRGEIFGLLGPNGAGKTTCFALIVGLLRADGGRILLNGRDITHAPIHRRARAGLAYLPQEASIFRHLTVRENLLAVLELQRLSSAERRREADRLLAELGIDHLAEQPSIALSGGERRRLEIARALAVRPQLILLDEPFAGVDPIAVSDIQRIVRYLQQRGVAILITDHNVRETLGICDRAAILADGRVITSGTPDEIVEHPDVRRVYLGDRFRL
ncbi:MAG: LPS export ABC transporter ATP-binding protein [Hydrogenophilus sp.]|nr:LPS export ABC transporter ATP-binding protein [Hydrogenophilus sp.]